MKELLVVAVIVVVSTCSVLMLRMMGVRGIAMLRLLTIVAPVCWYLVFAITIPMSSVNENDQLIDLYHYLNLSFLGIIGIGAVWNLLHGVWGLVKG